MPAWPEPVRDALRCGENQATPNCQSVTEERHRARVHGAAERLLRDGDGGAAHADGFHAVAIREVAVGRLRGERCGGKQCQTSVLFSSLLPFAVDSWSGRDAIAGTKSQMNKLTSASFAIGRNVAAPT